MELSVWAILASKRMIRKPRPVVERFSDTLGIVRTPEAGKLMQAHQLSLMSVIPSRSSLVGLVKQEVLPEYDL